MELDQSDRDALRASQQRLNNEHMIGNIIEHRTQNPRRYLETSRQTLSKRSGEQDSANMSSSDEVPGQRTVKIRVNESKDIKLDYTSEYISDKPKSPMSAIPEDKKNELPENFDDLQSNSWLNMDQIEFEKLGWMSETAKRAHQERLKSTTQFDKDGRAIAGEAVIKIEQSGDQDLGQTHDLETLIMLLDSTYDPKVTYSMNVISKIASLVNTGYYDGVFDDNIYETLLSKCLLRVRHHLDSTNLTVFLSALKCLRSLLCNTRVDEVILDRIWPITSQRIDPNLWLQTFEMESREMTIDMKDVECIEVDAVLALICRTDLLVKFTYLLENKKETLSETCRDCILDILIRIARHSHLVCYLISKRSLLTSVIGLFLRLPDSLESKMSRQLCAKALKLLRLVAQAAFEAQEDKRSKLHGRINTKVFDLIFESLEAYLAIDCYDQTPSHDEQLLKIHIEALRMTKTLIRLDCHKTRVLNTMSLLQSKLLADCRSLSILNATKPIESRISFDWQRAAHLIDLIGHILNLNRSESNSVNILWSTYIKPVLYQWTRDVIDSNEVPYIDISIAVATGIDHINRRIDHASKNELYERIIDGIFKIAQAARRNHYFKLITKATSENSQVNETHLKSGRLRDPKGLPSFGCLQFNLTTEHRFDLHPVIDNYSPFILFDTIIHVIPIDRSSYQDKINQLINDPNLNRYLSTISSYQSYPRSYEPGVQQSYLDQYEIRIASRVLHLLSHHFLYNSLSNDTTPVVEQVPRIEPNQVSKIRVTSYNNLCYYSINIIGLLNSLPKYAVEIKCKLFEELLLNPSIHDRLMREVHINRPNVPERRIDGVNPATGESLYYELNNEHLTILSPLYICSDHPNRFWIFQPMIDYYVFRLKEPEQPTEGDNPDQKDKWFRYNMPWTEHACQPIFVDDSVIFNSVLVFNHTMMLFSASYLSLIKSNLEDYICLIGTLFLDDNVFLDENVAASIADNMKTILRCLDESDITPFRDASKIIGPLELPLADFFNKLLDQFEAASYGDSGFSNFLTLFLTTKSDKFFRRKLFQEKAETCLRQMRIGIDELWAPINLFRFPEETDSEILNLIKRSKRFISQGSFLAHYYEFTTSRCDNM